MVQNLFSEDTNGKEIAWHGNGQIAWEDNYKDGELHGESLDWSLGGSKIRERYFKDGERCGRWKWHNETVVTEEDYGE